MEKALGAVHQGLSRRGVFSIGIENTEGQIGLFVRCGQSLRRTVIEPIEANYPHCVITEDADRFETPETTDFEEWSVAVQLSPELFPVLRHSQFEDMLNHSFADPLSSLLRAMRSEEAQASIEFSLRPASHAKCSRAFKAIKLLDRHFFRSHHRFARFFAKNILHGRLRWLAWILGRMAAHSPAPSHTMIDTTGSRTHDREDDVQAAADKIGGHLFETSIQIRVRVPFGQRQLAHERLNSIVGALGAFTRSRLATFKMSKPRRGSDHARLPVFLMSHEELATLWHPPTATVAAERMRVTEIQELEAPLSFHSEKEKGSVALGRVRFRDDRRLVYLGQEDRRRHLYIVGKTGMGKTTLLQNMIAHDLLFDRGLCLVDPHGDLAETITGIIPRHRTNDVILFDAASRDCAVGFNPLACPDPTRIDQVTSGVVSAFKKLHDSWGPRLEDTLRNAVFAIVEQGGNLLSVMRLLGERSFREQVVPNIQDEIVRSFWMHEFAAWSDNYRTEAVAAIQNKIRPFLTNTNIRAIVSSPGKTIDLRRIMDDGKVLIVNLSKGRLGEDNSTLLGAFLVTSIQQAAMTRADVPEDERRDFALYVDEFQNFTTGSFAAVLSEARKYRLSLIVAHQYLSQLDKDTSGAVFGNVGSIIAFQVGSDDADVLAQQLGKFRGQIGVENFTGLPKYVAYTRLLIDGMPSNPFSIQTLPPLVVFEPERAEIVRRVTNRRFGANRVAKYIEQSLVGVGGKTIGSSVNFELYRAS